jgi:hypothetical protein
MMYISPNWFSGIIDMYSIEEPLINSRILFYFVFFGKFLIITSNSMNNKI